MTLYICLPQVIVRRWDQKEERLVKISEEEVCNHFSRAYFVLFCFCFWFVMHMIGRQQDPSKFIKYKRRKLVFIWDETEGLT